MLVYPPLFSVYSCPPSFHLILLSFHFTLSSIWFSCSIRSWLSCDLLFFYNTLVLNFSHRQNTSLQSHAVILLHKNTKSKTYDSVLGIQLCFSFFLFVLYFQDSFLQAYFHSSSSSKGNGTNSTSQQRDLFLNQSGRKNWDSTLSLSRWRSGWELGIKQKQTRMLWLFLVKDLDLSLL